MPYNFTDEGLAVQEQVRGFLRDHIYPNEDRYHAELLEVGPDGYPPILDKLKAAAMERGLWKPSREPHHEQGHDLDLRLIAQDSAVLTYWQLSSTSLPRSK